MSNYRWQDAAAAIVGALIIVAPLLVPMAFPGSSASRLIYIAYFFTGFAVLTVAVTTILWIETWQEWLQVVLALWSIALPWALGFGAMIALSYSTVAAGGVLLLLAATALVSERRPPSSTW